MRGLLGCGLISTMALVVTPAIADEPQAVAAGHAEGGKEFGNPGTINVGAETSLDFAYKSSKPPSGDSDSSTTIAIVPSADYFVIEGLSVGGMLSFAMSSQKAAGATDSTKITTFGIGPRVGYNYWITPGSLSVWPKLTLGYASNSSSVGGNDAGSGSTVGLEIGVPLLIHPVSHFHFGIGPYFHMDLSSSYKAANGTSGDGSKETVFGLRGEIAGWL